MKERPILFSGPMVRALLAGRKTQTRRILKPQPLSNGFTSKGFGLTEVYTHEDHLPPDALLMRAGTKAHPYYATQDEWSSLCPYGAPGDRLWVKETWGLSAYSDDTDWLRGSVKGRSQDDLTGSWKLRFAADYDGPTSSEYPYWRPSIFMPRWASRLTLEVTEVRVERVQDISEADARAEGTWLGLGVIFDVDCRKCDTAVKRFKHLWDSINGGPWKCWDDNPWVWVVGFRRVDG